MATKYDATDPDTGEYGAISYTRHPGNPKWWLVLLGERQIGICHPPYGRWDGWTATSMLREPVGQRQVKGFHTRRHAMFYILSTMKGDKY